MTRHTDHKSALSTAAALNKVLIEKETALSTRS